MHFSGPNIIILMPLWGICFSYVSSGVYWIFPQEPSLEKEDVKNEEDLIVKIEKTKEKEPKLNDTFREVIEPKTS